MHHPDFTHTGHSLSYIVLLTATTHTVYPPIKCIHATLMQFYDLILLENLCTPTYSSSDTTDTLGKSCTRARLSKLWLVEFLETYL